MGWSLNKYQFEVKEIELKINLIINVFSVITSCDEYIVIKTGNLGTMGLMLTNVYHPIHVTHFPKK